MLWHQCLPCLCCWNDELQKCHQIAAMKMLFYERTSRKSPKTWQTNGNSRAEQMFTPDDCYEVTTTTRQRWWKAKRMCPNESHLLNFNYKDSMYSLGDAFVLLSHITKPSTQNATKHNTAQQQRTLICRIYFPQFNK